MPRLLLADRVKGPRDSFLAPLIPALRSRYDVRFISRRPGRDTGRRRSPGRISSGWNGAGTTRSGRPRSGVLRGKPCIVRLHSIEALQTDYPAQVDWRQVHRLITVGGRHHRGAADRRPRDRRRRAGRGDPQRHRPRPLRRRRARPVPDRLGRPSGAEEEPDAAAADRPPAAPASTRATASMSPARSPTCAPRATCSGWSRARPRRRDPLRRAGRATCRPGTPTRACCSRPRCTRASA